MTNAEIAEKLREMAVYYEMKLGPTVPVNDPLRFKPRAYARAAEAVIASAEPLEELCRHEGEKTIALHLAGVGPAIAAHICTLVATGTFPELERERKKTPVAVTELMRVGGLGPKSIYTLWTKLKIKTVDDLERAAAAHKIDRLPHFGEKSEQKILKSIALLRLSSGRHLLGAMLPLAQKLEEHIKKIPGVTNTVTAGSVRRKQETIGDIDILVTAKNPDAVHEHFAKIPEVRAVTRRGKGEGITSVILHGGIPADVRILKKDEYGAGLQYFTGDKNHNVKLRTLAIKKGYKLSEYGLFKGTKRVAGKTEEEIYKTLGLAYIPPELRTDTGELTAARSHNLPNLIGYNDLRGDLQVQTNWTDGHASILEMVTAAKKRGLDYIAITDHTVALAMMGGLDEKKLANQKAEIARVNKKLKNFRVLSGAEVNIGKDGSLDINDATLATLDVVGVSVHSYFTLPRAAQTKRLIRAIQNPHVDIVFHPTGRKIGAREPIDIDMEAVLAACRKNGTALEVNGSPERLDLRDAHVRMAVKAGVQLVIDSDAHAPAHFADLESGIAQARRGWAEKKDVLNTRPVAELLKWLRTPKNRRT